MKRVRLVVTEADEMGAGARTRDLWAAGAQDASERGERPTGLKRLNMELNERITWYVGVVGVARA